MSLADGPPPEDALCRLAVPAESSIDPDLVAAMEAEREELGFVPNVLRVVAIRQPYLRAWMAMMDDLVSGPSDLTPVQRETIAVVVSALNRCHYCMVSHGAALRRLTGDPVLVDQLLTNHRAAPLPTVDRALVELAAAITTRPDAAGEADWAPLREAGLSDAAIFDAVAVASLFNMTNRVLSTVGARPNREYHEMGRSEP